MEKGSIPEFRDQLVKRLVPLGRFCNLDDIAEAAVFLASARSDMITGQLLAVDGGLLIGFGEDLRPIVRKRMAEAKAAEAANFKKAYETFPNTKFIARTPVIPGVNAFIGVHLVGRRVLVPRDFRGHAHRIIAWSRHIKVCQYVWHRTTDEAASYPKRGLA